MEQGPVVSAEVERAKRRFVEAGEPPGEAVAPYIVHSWGRCRSLVPALALTEPLQRERLVERRDAAAELLHCAMPELDALAEHAVRQGCVAILSDATGLILDEVGSVDFLSKAEQVALLPGTDWSESGRGTNAIGTALQERDAVLVRGAEHFLRQNGALGCAAAPILDAQGALAGALDISGDPARIDDHALGLVRMAAAQVEHRMLGRHPAAELVRFHWRPALLGTAREGLLAVDGGRIVGLNRVAVRLLGGGWSDWVDRPVERLFGERWGRLLQQPGLFAAPDGRQWAVAVERRHPVQHPTRDVDEGIRPGTPRREVPADPLEVPLQRAVRALDAGLPVLVNGETGCGKDHFTRLLHGRSRRAGQALVAVNCAALPETLIEAELFGYEDGAFTGARRRGLPGRLREADGGVLFLDEIGDMPLALQTRLLQVLEHRRVRPLGATRDVAVDFDLVCATHRDLDAMVREGRFREDLLYRLQGLRVTLPPLRARPDRRALVLALFEGAGARVRGLRLSDQALDLLDNHPWPGNVRELIAVLRGLVALAEDAAVIGVADLPDTIVPPAAGAVPGMASPPATGAPPTLAVLERDAIAAALAAHGGSVARAARALGMHRSTLYRRLRPGGNGGEP